MTELTKKFQKGVLKLAESMEQGCKKTKKASGAYIRGKPGAVQACALGAALINGYSADSALKTKAINAYELVTKRFPVLYDTDAEGTKLATEIVVRNDERRHTREKIVAWLRRVAKLSKMPLYWRDVK